MEYVVGGFAIASILAVAIGIPYTLGLFRRPDPIFYVVRWEDELEQEVVETPRMERNRTAGSKRLVTNRPKAHERVAQREAQKLTDEALDAALDRWREAQGL